MSGHRVDIGARHRGDAREVLDGVQSAALGGQQGAGVAGDPHQRGARARRGRHPCTSISISHAGVEMAEERGGQRQPGDGDRIAAVHHPGKARLGGDDALGGDVAPATGQPLAQILGQRGADESGKVEAGQIEVGAGEGGGHGDGI